MDKKLKDLKDEVLVVTNAAEGNTPHVVEDIEPEGGLKTRPLAGAKPSDQFMRIDRNVSILETFFLNMKRQFERAVRLPLLSPSGGLACLRQGACRPVQAARK